MQALEKRKRSDSQANRQLKKDKASGKWFVLYLHEGHERGVLVNPGL